MFTGLLWIPVVINRVIEKGLWPALKNPQAEKLARTEWGNRANRAHLNAIENLVVFAPLVIIIEVTALNSAFTGILAMLYFFTRIAHFFAYLFAVPLIRTLLFLAGVTAQMLIGYHILSF